LLSLTLKSNGASGERFAQQCSIWSFRIMDELGRYYSDHLLWYRVGLDYEANNHELRA
jgi:hypothetical protein